MKLSRGGLLKILLVLGGSLAAVVLIAWIIALATVQNLSNPIATVAPWPIACSAKGCVTTHDWERSLKARQMFAEALEEEKPVDVDALTTTIRHHLVNHSYLPAAVTAEDAERYRKEILHLEDKALVQEISGLTLEEYDKTVLVPLLRQEALKQQRNSESFEALFKTLATERKIVVLAWGLKWNAEEARVVTE